MSGTCTGKDELAEWVDDATKAKMTLQPPWKKSPISIVGATIAWIDQIYGFQYAYLGNNF